MSTAPYGDLLAKAFLPVMPLEFWEEANRDLPDERPSETATWFDMWPVPGEEYGVFLPDDRTGAASLAFASHGRDDEPLWLSITLDGRRPVSVAVMAEACEPHPNDPRSCVKRWCTDECRKRPVLNRHGRVVPKCLCSPPE
jgi:hypothetical protein